MKLFWLPEAITDRIAQVDYLFEKSPQAALNQDRQIELQIEALQIYPEIGRKGRVKGTRELIISQTPLIVIYRIKPKTKHIKILRILHHAQKQNLLMQN